ncbi:MAG: hypothetical protein BIFFINMI_01880 [Phycisphaerae bacterium]|nr:hypothetical protein [Phycisphaerae bacterium]
MNVPLQSHGVLMAADWSIPDAPISLPWGDGELPLDLPGGWPVFLARPDAPPAPDRPLAEMLQSALAEPLDAPPLAKIARRLSEKSGSRIAIVVDDNSRHTPVADVLPVLLREIKAGQWFDDSRIEIHFASGMHTPMTPAEMADRIGADLAARFACCNNPWHDPSQYRYLGRTRNATPIHLSARVADADLRILVGSVNAHMQAGFAGGMKLLFPGCASLGTIRRLHLRGTGVFRQRIGVPVAGNPMRQEIDSIFEYLPGLTFNVQLMLDGRFRVLQASAGHPIASQRAIAADAARRFGVALPGPADLVVSNGFPLELDFWQGFKSVANTVFAARPGGVVVALMRCAAGANNMPIPKWWFSRRVLRAVMRVTGRDGLISLMSRLTPQLHAEARFFVRFALSTIARNPVLVYSPNLVAEGVRFPGIEISDDLPALLARAAGLLGGAIPPNVTVFPEGGVCYPLAT